MAKPSTSVPSLSSITVMKAVTTGWAEQYKLTARELAILTYVVTWGWRDDPRYEFSWCPIVGVEGWAYQMGIPDRAFRRAWAGLVKKGVLVAVSGNKRFPTTRGLAMTPEMAHECAFWAGQRNPFSKPDDMHPNDTSASSTGQKCPVKRTETSGKADTTVQTAPPLTCGFTSYTPEVPQRDPLPYGSDACASHQERKDSLLEDDGWDQPSDDDGAAWSEPSDRPGKPKRRAQPSSRLAQHFWDEWVVTREERTALAIPWNTKAIFLKNLNRLLATNTEEQLAEQITVFFRQVRTGQARTRSDELWKDFLANRGQAHRIAVDANPGDNTEAYIAAVQARQGQA